MGIKKTGRKWQETIGNGGKFYWQPRSTMKCCAWERGEEWLK